jgi:hypothetical protein
MDNDDNSGGGGGKCKINKRNSGGKKNSPQNF